jgi:hypothetical protein
MIAKYQTQLPDKRMLAARLREFYQQQQARVTEHELLPLRHPVQYPLPRLLGLWVADEHASIISAKRAGILQSGPKLLTSAVQTHFDSCQGPLRRGVAWRRDSASIFHPAGRTQARCGEIAQERKREART